MTLALIPDFSFSLPGLPERVPFHADPILTAIERHEEALYRVAAAREADLTLLLGCDGIARIPSALPLGRLPAIEAWPAPDLT